MAFSDKKKAKKPKAEAETLPEGMTADEHRAKLLCDIFEMTGGAPLSTSGLSIHVPGVIPSGDPWLDLALGRGGWPLSRIVLVSGKEGCGKTTLALQACARVQRAGGLAIYFDAEHKLDKAYAISLGVDVDRLILYQSKHIESAMTTLEKILVMAKKHREAGNIVPILIVIDSLNAMPSKMQVEAEFEELRPGAQARAWSACLMKINPLLSQEHANLFLLSQVRKDFNVEFGDDETTGGGAAPRFYAAIIVSMMVTAQIKDGADSKAKKIGNRVHVKVSKNQVAPPFQECHFLVRFGEGTDDIYGLHEAMKAQDMLENAGSWFTVKESSPLVKYQGQPALRHIIEEEDGELHERLEKMLRATYPALGIGDETK